MLRKKRRADPTKKETIRELLQRLRLGILQPRYCEYTDTEGKIEFGVICHLFKAISEEERAEIADCVRELYEEGQFSAKEWITEVNEDCDSYRYPPILTVRLE